MKNVFYGLAAFAVGLGAFLLYYYLVSDSPSKLSDIDKINAKRDSVANLPAGKSPKEVEADIRSSENSRPLDYIDLTYEIKEKFLRKRNLKIEIELENKSKYTSYKEFSIEVKYINGSDKEIGSATEILFDQLAPGEKRSSQIDKRVPEETNSYLLELTNAVSVEAGEQ